MTRFSKHMFHIFHLMMFYLLFVQNDWQTRGWGCVVLNSFVESFCSFIFICSLVLSIRSPKLKEFDCLFTSFKIELFSFMDSVRYFFLLGYWWNMSWRLFCQYKRLHVQTAKKPLQYRVSWIIKTWSYAMSISWNLWYSRYFKSIFFVKDLFREMVVVVRDESGGWLQKQFGEALFSNILILKLPHSLPI